MEKVYVFKKFVSKGEHKPFRNNKVIYLSKHGIKQDEIAKIMGICQSNVNRILKKRKEVNKI